MKKISWWVVALVALGITTVIVPALSAPDSDRIVAPIEIPLIFIVSFVVVRLFTSHKLWNMLRVPRSKGE